MIYSRTGEEQKGQKIRVRKMSSENDQFGFEATRKELKSYLESLSIPPEQFQELSSIANLKDMIQKFSEMLTNSLRRHPSTGSLMDDNFFYYQRRQVVFQEKINKLNEEVVKLMNALSLKEQELAEREGEIFSWKLKLEEKQKTILLLRTNGTQQMGKNVSNKKSQVKINVNQPKAKDTDNFSREQSSIIPLHEERRGKKSREQIREEFPQSWREERKRLLKMLREKDMKIYQLIQEINKLQHR